MKKIRFNVGDSFQCEAFVKRSAQGQVRRLEVIWTPNTPNRPLTEKESADYQRGLMLVMTANSD